MTSLGIVCKNSPLKLTCLEVLGNLALDVELVLDRIHLHLSGKIHHDILDQPSGTLDLGVLDPGIPFEAAPAHNLDGVGLHTHVRVDLRTHDRVDLRTYDRVDPDTHRSRLRSLDLDTNDDRPFLKNNTNSSKLGIKTTINSSLTIG